MGAPVVFGDDTLFTLFGKLGPFTSSERAAAASERLGAAAKAITRGDSITVTDQETFSELAVSDGVLMTVLDADAEPIGTPRAELARRYAAQLRAAFALSAERLTTRALAIDAGYAVLATIALVLLLFVFKFAFPHLYQRIEALRRVRLASLRIQKFELLSSGRLSSLLLGVARGLRALLTLLLFYIYVPLVLGLFPWTVTLSHRIVGLALRPFAAAWHAFANYLPSLFYLIAGVVIVRYTLAFLRLLVDAVHSGAITLHGFYADWAEPTYKIVRVLVVAMAAVALYPYFPGASSDAFKGVSLFVGVLFSLGSSAAVGNMVAGVVLTYTRAFQIGDRVKIGDTVGDVTEKTLLVTRVRTIKNVEVTIPNGSVLSGHVVNYTSLADTRGLILHTAVTIGYDAPWTDVHRLLINAAVRAEHVLKDPPPFVLQTSLDDFYVTYELNAYTNRADVMATSYSQLHQLIQDDFAKAGVEIMSPHYAAQRDGNQTTIPASYLPRDYQAPSFRVDIRDNAIKGSGD